ncbi:MAG: hypothetical protein AAGA18_14925 [Verrucomicrobiota bacterium]
MSNIKKAWLCDASWEVVEAINKALCENKNALHKPTSDGYEKTKALWTSNHLIETSLLEAVELCRKCPKLAPFCYYNGNTFVAIIRQVIEDLHQISPDQLNTLRSVSGHIVAGTANFDEEKLLRDMLNNLSF